MLYWLFTTYRAIFAPWVTPPLVCLALIAPVIAVFLLGSPGRKSADHATSLHQHRITAVTLAIVALAATHLALGLFGGRAVESVTPTPVDPLLHLLSGPPGFDHARLVAMGGLTLIAGLGAAIGAHSLIADGGPLREASQRLRDPSRRRQELGSATFCLPGDFARLQRPKPGGLILLGAFYGKEGRGAAPHRFTRLDAGPHRGYAGRGLCLSVEDQARGMAFLGPSGSGKSQAGILPVAADTLALDHSLILADPQGELAPHILDYAAVTGHRVILHDPTDPALPRYNLAEGIHDVAEAQAITRVLIPDLPQGGEGFWQKSAQNLLAACLLRYDSLGDILLALSDIPALAARLGQIQDGAAYLAASFIASARTDGKVAASTLATLHASTLSAWAEEAVRQATSAIDFSARMLVDQPCVLLLRCPARYVKVYGPYLGAVLQRMMLDLDTLGADAPGGMLERPVKILLDEFPMLGRLDAVVEAVNLFRKRRISFVIAAQTLSQLELVYGKAAAEALVAGLATQVIFGSCDAVTAAYVSRMLGRATERTPGRREGEPTLLRGRELMSVDEVITPPVGNCTLIYRYATPTYAAQLVMLAALTPMYERADWQQKVERARREGHEALVMEGPPVARQVEQTPMPITSIRGKHTERLLERTEY